MIWQTNQICVEQPGFSNPTQPTREFNIVKITYFCCEVKRIFSRSFIIYQLPLYFYVVVIFVLSSIPPDSMPDMDTRLDVDKAIHFVEYAILGFLLFRALFSSGRISARWSAVLALCCAVALGGIDELYQSLPGRNTSVYDWISDSLGAAVAIVCCLVLYEKVRGNLRARRARNFSS